MLNKLSGMKHALIRRYDRNEIDETTYKKELEDIEGQIGVQREAVLAERDKIQKKLEAKEMDKEEKPEIETKKIGRKERKNSYTMLIIEALKMKSIKSVDAAVDKVLEQKPGRDRTKVKTQLRTIIGLVKKQKPARWTKYSWDEEAFLLTEK